MLKLLLRLAVLFVCLIWLVATGSQALKLHKWGWWLKWGAIQRKRVMWLRRTVGGKRQEAQLFIPYRLHGWHGPNDYFGIFTYIAKTKWGCSTLQEFLNHIAPSQWTVAYPATLPPLPQSRNINQSLLPNIQSGKGDRDELETWKSVNTLHVQNSNPES